MSTAPDRSPLARACSQRWSRLEQCAGCGGSQCAPSPLSPSLAQPTSLLGYRWPRHTAAQDRNRRLRQDLQGEVFLKSRIIPILFHRCRCTFRANYFIIGSHARIDVSTLRAVVTMEHRFEFMIHAGEIFERIYHLRVPSGSDDFSRFVYGLRRLTQRDGQMMNGEVAFDTGEAVVGSLYVHPQGQKVRRPDTV